MSTLERLKNLSAASIQKKFKKKPLQEFCAEFGLNKKGTKKDLAQRIYDHIQARNEEPYLSEEEPEPEQTEVPEPEKAEEVADKTQDRESVPEHAPEKEPSPIPEVEQPEEQVLEAEEEIPEPEEQVHEPEEEISEPEEIIPEPEEKISEPEEIIPELEEKKTEPEEKIPEPEEDSLVSEKKAPPSVEEAVQSVDCPAPVEEAPESLEEAPDSMEEEPRPAEESPLPAAVESQPQASEESDPVAPQEKLEEAAASALLAPVSSDEGPMDDSAGDQGIPDGENSEGEDGDEGYTVPLPPKQETLTTDCVQIEGFKRPVNEKNLEVMVGEHGRLAHFWMDTFKSVCLVQFEDELCASKFVDSTNNTHYPSHLPKEHAGLLTMKYVQFSDFDELKKVIEETKKPKSVVEVSSRASSLVESGHNDPPSQDKPKEFTTRKRKREDEDNEETIKKQMQKNKEFVLEVFKKTKAKPELYYKPLTDEEIAERKKKNAARNSAPFRNRNRDFRRRSRSRDRGRGRRDFYRRDRRDDRRDRGPRRDYYRRDRERRDFRRERDYDRRDRDRDRRGYRPRRY